MSIELRPSTLCSDVRCTVCGQGFLLFSSRLAHLHHYEVLTHVQQALRRRHTDCDNDSAHPAEGFCMPLVLEMLSPASV